MSGGQAGLRSAAKALGVALAIVGAFSLIRGFVAESPRSNRMDSSLRFASASPLSKRAAASVLLGPLETDDLPRSHTVRSLSTQPTQFTAQIELDDTPPPPAKPTDSDDLNVTEDRAPQKPPVAELMDVEPMPAEQTPLPPESKLPTGPECCERQEQQLARIAFGIEMLGRLGTQAILQPAPIVPTQVPLETFVKESDRAKTAVIKLERTAEDRNRFSLELHAAPVDEVLRLLCDLANLKLEMSPEVTERVTLTIRDVTLGEAINAVLKQADLGVEREEQRLRVMPRIMAEERATRRQPLVTKTYRPSVASVSAVVPLIRPLLTPRLGRLAVLPDSTRALCPDVASPGSSTPTEILVIIDRAEVHAEVEKLLKDLDGKMATP